MIRAHLAAAVRESERQLMAALPPGTLMQRAATGLAVACAQRLGRVYGSRVVLLVGSGDNGADALWAGSLLARRGALVTAVTTGRPVAEALAAFLRAGGRLGAAADLDDADLVLDGLVGIGAIGPLRPEAAALALLADGPHVVAVDLPSGVDADTGVVAGVAVRAGLTVTFGAMKPGLLLGAGREHAGTVLLVEIGLTLPTPMLEALEPLDAALLLPRGQATSDKYTRGVLGVCAGSVPYTGAALLSAGAAVRAGAGMVRFAGAAAAADLIRSRWPEVVVTEATGAAVVEVGRVQAWVVGPGLGTDAVAAASVEAVLAQDVPVLVDADALTLCAQHPEWLQRRTAPTLLTPHDREYARFGRSVGPDRLGAASWLAAELGVAVLLKGDATVVVDGDRARVGRTGTPVLATAGSGDVLAGAAGALLAQGLGALDAGSLAVHLHGRAGTLSADGATTSASLLLEAWPDAVREARAATGTASGRMIW